VGNSLVHLDAIGIAATAELGNRIGIATLLMLISLVGGRIIPSFTRNWLAKEQPYIAPPAPFGVIDRAVLVIVALALVIWVMRPRQSSRPGSSLPRASLSPCALRGGSGKPPCASHSCGFFISDMGGSRLVSCCSP